MIEVIYTYKWSSGSSLIQPGKFIQFLSSYNLSKIIPIILWTTLLSVTLLQVPISFYQFLELNTNAH